MPLAIRNRFIGDKNDLSLKDMTVEDINCLLVQTCKNEVLDKLHAINPLRIGSNFSVFLNNSDAQFALIGGLLKAGASPKILDEHDVVMFSSEGEALKLAIRYSIFPLLHEYIDNNKALLLEDNFSDGLESLFKNKWFSNNLSKTDIVAQFNNTILETARYANIEALTLFLDNMNETLASSLSHLLFYRALSTEEYVRCDFLGEEKDKLKLLSQQRRKEYILILLERFPELLNKIEISLGDIESIIKLDGDVIIKKLCELGCDIYGTCPKFVDKILSARKTTPLKFLKSAKHVDDFVKSAVHVYLHKSKKAPYEAIERISNPAIEPILMEILMQKVAQ